MSIGAAEEGSEGEASEYGSEYESENDENDEHKNEEPPLEVKSTFDKLKSSNIVEDMK